MDLPYVVTLSDDGGPDLQLGTSWSGHLFVPIKIHCMPHTVCLNISSFSGHFMI